MEQSVIKYLQIKIKPLSLSYKIHQVKTLTIKSPNIISNMFGIVFEDFIASRILNSLS